MIHFGSRAKKENKNACHSIATWSHTSRDTVVPTQIICSSGVVDVLVSVYVKEIETVFFPFSFWLPSCVFLFFCWFVYFENQFIWEIVCRGLSARALCKRQHTDYRMTIHEICNCRRNPWHVKETKALPEHVVCFMNVTNARGSIRWFYCCYFRCYAWNVNDFTTNAFFDWIELSKKFAIYENENYMIPFFIVGFFLFRFVFTVSLKQII